MFGHKWQTAEGTILRSHVDETGTHSYDVQLPLPDGSARQVRVPVGQAGGLQPGQHVQLLVSDSNGQVQIDPRQAGPVAAPAGAAGPQPAGTPAPGGRSESETVAGVRRKSSKREKIHWQKPATPPTAAQMAAVTEAFDAAMHGGVQSRVEGFRRLEQVMQTQAEWVREHQPGSNG